MSAAGGSLFTTDPRHAGAGGQALVASEHARGPWDEGALHGGAPAALITSAFEHFQPREELRFARLTFELLRPVPFAPFDLEVRVVRDGRRVQELGAELRADGRLVCRAAAVRVARVPDGLPDAAAGAPAEAPMPGPGSGEPIRFALDGSDARSFASTAMEMRAVDDPRGLGPARVWMRLTRPLLDGEAASSLARVAATCDFGNGISATLPFDRYVFINADLSIQLHRAPRGEWIGLDARTVLQPDGCGLAESVVHDEHGPVGRAFQTLVVAPR
ncbi:MAG TPA: thioesterase family protein [Solirubrobacteraceae bacterium]|nr:thioesterase family protein [Solirubrobacteraceae bacterium]